MGPRSLRDRKGPLELRVGADERLDPGELARVLPPGGLTLVSACSAESAILAEAVMGAGAALGPMTFSGLFVPGLNRRTWLANPACRVVTFFMTSELRAAGDRVDFLSLCYEDILAWYRRQRPQSALFMCSPPDANGRCSFGTEVAFIADLWRDIPIRIAHINPAMPRTLGDAGIPFEDLTAFVTADQALLTTEPGVSDDSLSRDLAANIVPYIGDGATLQTGIGKLPDAILRSLTHRRGLRIHSGLVGDGVLDLLRSGALAADVPITAGVAIGSAELYASVSSGEFQFRPVSVTHGHAVLAAIDGLITINSAFEVDLFGQAYAELGPAGLVSGPGGASDFARGARGSGLRIVAAPSTAAAGSVSRIVPPGAGAGPVSLGRMDIDLVVTEHGVADLRGRGYVDRATALTAVAAPRHRAALSTQWTDTVSRF